MTPDKNREAARRQYLADGISRFIMDLVTRVDSLEKERDELSLECSSLRLTIDDQRRRLAELSNPVREPNLDQIGKGTAA